MNMPAIAGTSHTARTLASIEEIKESIIAENQYG